MRALLFAVLLVPLAACATAGSSTETRTSRNEITRADIEAATGATTAYEVVRRLRPQWLRTRGQGSMHPAADEGIVIYVDGARAGVIPAGTMQSAGPNPLETLTTDRVERIRYYGASIATQRFGTGHPHGAIEVVTRR